MLIMQRKIAIANNTGNNFNKKYNAVLLDIENTIKSL